MEGMSMQNTQDLVVIGGGITGLTATYYLQEEIKRNDLPYRVQLLEASERLGGKINTLRKDGFIIERGADSFLGRKKQALELVDKLGLTDELVRNKVGQAYILLQDQLHPIPEGSFMGIPTKLLPLLQTNLLSWRGKVRLMSDFLIAKGKEMEDQSLGYFLRRRLGNEVVDHIIEPLLSGVYSSDIDRMSIMSTFPNFYHLEQKQGSLIKGLRKSMPKKRRNTGKRPGQFFTFKQGLSRLPEELFNNIDDGTVSLHTKVKKVERKESYYKLYTSTGIIHSKACLFTIPHKEVLSLFKNRHSFTELEEIPVSSVANVVFAFRKEDLTCKTDGTGFVVSRKGDYHITACTWTTEKWPHTTPADYVLLRAYVGKPTEQGIVFLSDEEIIEKVMTDLKKVLPIQSEPLFHYVTRYTHLMPQYTVGHKRRLSSLKQSLEKELPGIFVAGSSYQGVGIPDCIEQAKNASSEILKYLGEA